MIKEYAGPILDEIGKALEDLDYSVLWKMVAEIHGANRIFFHAVGRPELPMKNFAMYLKHFGYRVHVVGDVTCPAIKPGDVFFVVSGTGETKTSLGMVKKCKEIGEIKVLLMTAAEKSSIGELADQVLRVNCPLPGVPSTVSSVQPIGSLFDECVLYRPHQHLFIHHCVFHLFCHFRYLLITFIDRIFLFIHCHFHINNFINI